MCRFDTGNMDTGKEGGAALCRMSGNFLERCREQAGRLGAKDSGLQLGRDCAAWHTYNLTISLVQRVSFFVLCIKSL